MIQGEIDEILYNDHEDADGWRLTDGTLVHFPVEVGEELGLWIDEGDEVEMEGESRIDRSGDLVFFPNYIESQGWSLTFDQHLPPPMRSGKPSDRSQLHEHEAPVTNEDIMRELIRIRKMLEKWNG
jgi:hypothetical protein